MSVQINGTNGLVFADGSTQKTAANGSFKNRIINGAMQIDQRNAGASVTPTVAGYTLDRWRAALSQTSKYSVQQSSTAPSGFTNSALITSLSAYTVGASESFRFEQFVEGFNASDLGWGTASAQTVTLSFWVRSSLTGTFGGAFLNSAENRSYPFSYTISSANTWEQKTVTVAGDTSGTWLTNNGIGIRVSFSLGAGSTVSGTAGSWSGNFYTSATGATSVVGTNGATFYITGVQLEKGSTATSFDYRPYGTELALCQRYCVVYGGDSNYERISMVDCVTTTASNGTIPLPATMRTIPSITVNSASNFAIYTRNVIITCTSFSAQFSSSKVFAVEAQVASGLTVGSAGQLVANNTTNARLTLSAEL